MITLDAEKEFSATSRFGYGIDGDQSVADADFTAVRGTAEGNSFIKSLADNSAEVTATAERLIAALEG